LEPAAYFPTSEYEFLGKIEIVGPTPPTTSASQAPMFSYTLLIRLHMPTGRCFVFASGYPYACGSIVDWYNTARRAGA